MMMGRLGLALCVLLSFAAADARRKTFKYHAKDRNNRLPTPPVCSTIQSFQPGFKYSYDYEAIIESKNNVTQEATVGKMIKCNETLVTIPRACVGSLTIKSCKVYEGVLLENGSLVYQNQTNAPKLEKMLRKYKLYFLFNQGEIGKLFYDRHEPTDVMNIKRGILSALQLKFSGSGLRKSANEKFVVPEVNIFGVGNSTVEVQTVQGGVAKNVQVTRDLDNFQLPWKRQQWTSFRSFLEKSDLSEFIADLFVNQSRNVTGNSSQQCQYKLARGRRVEEVVCLEQKPVNLFNNTLFKLILGQDSYKNFSSNTTVQLKIKLKKEPTKMSHSDRPHDMELARIQRHYKEENLMFEEQWEEAMESSTKHFDPIEAMTVLVRRPENKSTPTIFSKLGRYVSRCREGEIQKIWRQIKRRFLEGHELEKATNIWIQILNRCNSAPYWCPMPECEPNSACQNVLASFVETTSQSQWTDYIRSGVLEAISAIPYPNITIVQTGLDICTSNTTARTVMMLGKVLSRYAQHPEANLTHRTYIGAREYLVQILNTDCTMPRRDNYQQKSVKIAAINSLGALAENADVARQALVRCACNEEAPKEVSLNAIRSLQNIPLPQTERRNILNSTVQLRQDIVSNMENRNRSVTVRLASYLLIITKEPSVPEINRIGHMIVRDDEPRALKYYIKEHLKSQLLLRNTSFCELSPRTIENVLTSIRQRRLALGKNAEDEREAYTEKEYSTLQTIFVPVINREIECNISANLVFAKNSMVPILVNVSVTTDMDDNTITLIESILDFSKILAVLEPLFGEHGVFPEQELERFLNMPISQLLRPILRDQPLLQREELQRLTMIQDEGSLAYSMLMMKNKSPFELKILGIPLELKTILGLELIQNLKLSNMWKVVDILEKGWSFEGVVADQPMLAHIASPSSMGSPHIFSLEAAYFVHMHSKVIVPLKRIMLTREGNVTVKSIPTIRGSVMWNQKIQLPLSFSCGSGYQVSAGHNSKLQGEIRVKPNNMTLDLKPVLPETEILTFNVDDLIVNNSQIYTVERRQECPETCILPVTNCPGNALYYRACNDRRTKFGLYLRRKAEDDYHIVVSWNKTKSNEENRNEIVNVYNFAFQRYNIQRNRSVWSSYVNVIPAINTVKVAVVEEGQQTMSIDTNARIFRSPRVYSTFDKIFASFNVSKRINGRLSPVSVNKVLIRKDRQNSNLLSELGELIWFQESITQEDSNKVFYVIESDLELFGNAHMSGKGRMYINKTDGGYDAHVQIKQGRWTPSNERKLCSLNVTSSQITERNMTGFLTTIKMENISRFQHPFSFLNQFSRFNYSGKVLNDSVGNSYQENKYEANVKNEVEPYFLDSRSSIKKPKHNNQFAPYVFNSTHTINCAQLQIDVFSLNKNNIESAQRLILPTASISKVRMAPKQQSQIRISTSDPELSPTCYLNTIISDSSRNGTYHFKSNVSKVLPSRSQKPSKAVYYCVDVTVSPGECQGCHNVTVDVNGMKLKSEYAKKPNWHGHAVMIDMHQSYMQYVPISNKTKTILHRYIKSETTDRLKVGYIYKANQTIDNKYFYEVGYFVGDKALTLLGNLSLPNFKQLQSARPLYLRFNVTCNQCLLFSKVCFKSGLGLTYNITVQPKWRGQRAEAYGVDASFGFYEKDGIHTELGFEQSSTVVEERILDFITKLNATLVPQKSFVRGYLTEPRYDFATSINITILQKGEQHKTPVIYSVKYPVGFYPGAPLMQGNLTVCQQLQVNKSQQPNICPVGQMCTKHILEMVQNEKCKQYDSFYAARGRVSPFSSQNCTYNYMKLITSKNAWDLFFDFNAERNPDSVVRRFKVISVKEFNSDMTTNVTLNLTRHYYRSPLHFSANISETRQATDFVVMLNTREINAYSIKETGSRFLANITTKRIPMQLNCTCEADLRDSQRISYAFRNCNLIHPTWTNSTRLNINSSGDFNLQERRGQGHLHCGQLNNSMSPCEGSLQFDKDRVSFQVRLNNSVVNHTTAVQLNGTTIPNILDWNVDLQTSTSLKLNSKLNCTNCLNKSVSKKYGFDIIVNRNKLELLRFLGNSSNLPNLHETGAWYFHYISNQTADLDLYLSASVGDGRKLKTGMYKGLNQPQTKWYVKSRSPSDYIEGQYFQYIQCRNNLTFSSKTLYNNRPQREGRYIKLIETEARSNLWPISCNEEWKQIFKQIFPVTPVTPFCSGDMELRVKYDRQKNNQVKIDLFKQQAPIIKVVYHLTDRVHNVTAICENQQNPTCRMILLLNDYKLNINTSVNTTSLKHDSLIQLRTYRNGQSQFSYKLLLSTNNTITTSSQQPIMLTTNVTYGDEHGWYVYSKLNSTENLDNVILVQNSTLKVLRLRGKSVEILSEPRSWNVSYCSDDSANEIVAFIQLTPKSQLSASFYQGINQPQAVYYNPKIRQERFINGFSLNYTSCSQQRALIKWIEVLSQKNGKKLLEEVAANIDMWPLKNNRRIITWPLVEPCPFCLGELEFAYLLNQTEDTELKIQALLGKVSLLGMKYTIGNVNKAPKYYFHGKTEIIYNVEDESCPRMTLNHNVTLVSGQSGLIKIESLRKGFKTNNFYVNEHFEYKPQQNWKNNLTIDTKLVSAKVALASNRSVTSLSLRYPYNSESPVTVTMLLLQNDLEIKDIVIKTSLIEWNIRRIVLSLVRSQNDTIRGFVMRDVDLRIFTNLHQQQPDELRVVGNASIVNDGDCYINLTDLPQRNKFVISLRAQRTSDIRSRSFISIRLPVLEMDLNGSTNWTYDELKNNYNCTIMASHPFTNHMLPIFTLSVEDNFDKHQDCLFYGNMHWNINVWNSVYSDYHINPIFDLALRQKNQTESEMNIKLVLGEHNVTSNMNFTNQMQKFIPIYKKIGVCIPQIVSAKAKMQLPNWESKHQLDITPRTYNMTTNSSLLYELPLIEEVIALYNITNIMKFTLTPDNKVVGISSTNGTFHAPYAVPFKADCTILPSNSSARKFSCGYQLYDNEPVVLNITAPDSQNIRQVTANGFGKNMLSATLNVTECAMSLPVFPELFCMPRKIELNNINANVPVVRIISQLPFVQTFLPEIELYNIMLNRSSVALYTSTNGDNYTVQCNAKLSGPILPETFANCTSLVDLPWCMYEEAQMSTWIFNTTINQTAAGVELIFDNTVKMFMLEDHVRLHMINFTKVGEVIFIVNTKSMLEKLVPIDIDWEYKQDMILNNWTMNVRSLKLQVLKYVNAIASFKTDSKMKESGFNWTVNFEKEPVLNHSAGFSIFKDELSKKLKFNTNFSTALVSLNTSVVIGNKTIKVENFTLSLPTKSKGVKIMYEKHHKQAPQLKLYLRENELFKSECNATLSHNQSVLWKCKKLQIDPVRGWVPRESHVARHHFKVSFSNAFMIVKNALSFNYTHLQSQKWIEKTLERIVGIADQQLRQKIAKYVVNETKFIETKIQELLKLDAVNDWNSWVSEAIQAIPTLFPAAEYLNNTINTLKLLSQDALKMRVLNGSSYLALQYNISCPASKDIMFQVNLTHTCQGYPIVNMSLFTPFADQYMMFDIANLSQPLEIGIKSLLSSNKFFMNFTNCSNNEPCASTEFTLSGRHRYQCLAGKSQNEPDWDIVCNSVHNNNQSRREVARFTITSPSLVNFLQEMLVVTNKYMDNKLQNYLNRRMNIPAASSAFSNQLTKTVTNCYESLKELCYKIFPNKALQLYQLERLAKEAVSIGTHHARKFRNEGRYSTDYNKLLKSGVDYLSAVNSSSAVRIPILTFKLFFFDADLYVEIGKPLQRKVSFVLKTSLSRNPELKQESKVDLWYEEDKPFMRYTMNNTFMRSQIDVCLKNSSLVRAAVCLPEHENCLNVTYIGECDAPRMIYNISFVDLEDSRYVCIMKQVTNNLMTTRCTVQRQSEAEPRTISQFNTPVQSLSLVSMITKAGLIIPEMYVAAKKPETFKMDIKKVFKVTDEHSLNVVSKFLSDVSNRYIERLHQDYINLFANKVIDVPSLYDKDWASKAIVAVMTHRRMIQAYRQERSITQSAKDAVNDLGIDVVTSAMSALESANKTIQEIQTIFKGMLSAFSPIFAPMTGLYTVQNFVNDTYVVFKAMNLIQHVSQRIVHEPSQLLVALPELYKELRISEYLTPLLKIGGPVYEWTTGQRNSEVVSFNGTSFDLPLVDPNSDCMFVHLTDPLRNSFSIISKGNTILLAFPNKTIEITPERRVFVQTESEPRSETMLPLFIDEVMCKVDKRNQITCKCMEYSVTVKTGVTGRVRRTVTIFVPELVMGVMGTYCNKPICSSLLLPNGTEARNTAQLMNAYKLNNSQECIVSEQEDAHMVGFNSCKTICETLFKSQDLKEVKEQLPCLANHYLKKCVQNCRNNNKTQACEYVNDFIHMARSKRYSVQDVKECMPCKIKMLREDGLTVMEKAEVYLLVSMSRDRVQTDPRKTIRKLASKLVRRMQQQQLSNSKVGIVTYGGEGQRFSPMINSVKGLSVADNVEHLLNLIQKINFTGPSYDPATTVDALKFVSKTLRTAPKGIAKTVLVVAPETEQKNCGSQDVRSLVTELRNDLTSVFLWSSLSQQQCRDRRLNVVLDTEGVCMRASERTEDKMTSAIVNNLAEKIQTVASCNCKTVNPLTGEIRSECLRRSEQVINY